MPNARRKGLNRTTRPVGKEHTQETKHSLLKWVGGITAILSLIFGIRQATLLVSESSERQRQIEELFTIGKAQQVAGDYPAAWASFEQALKSAEEGNQAPKLLGRLGKERGRLRQAQEDLAMVWLQNIRIPEGQSFSDTVDKLVLVLNRGTTNEKGARKADLLAHVGWAYFLKSRDGTGAPNPEPHYRAALQIDPTNPYAHVYWAHWQLWQGGNLAEAQRHFADAIASGREREYVRSIQLAALLNSRSEETEAEFLRVVNEMRKNKEKIEDKIRNHLYSIYYFSCKWEDARFQKLVAAVPAAEQLRLFRELFYVNNFDASKYLTRDACYATLLEAAGRKEEALKKWMILREKYPDAGSSVFNRSEAAMKRLSPVR